MQFCFHHFQKLLFSAALLMDSITSDIKSKKKHWSGCIINVIKYTPFDLVLTIEIGHYFKRPGVCCGAVQTT